MCSIHRKFQFYQIFRYIVREIFSFIPERERRLYIEQHTWDAPPAYGVAFEVHRFISMEQKEDLLAALFEKKAVKEAQFFDAIDLYKMFETFVENVLNVEFIKEIERMKHASLSLEAEYVKKNQLVFKTLNIKKSVYAAFEHAKSDPSFWVILGYVLPYVTSLKSHTKKMQWIMGSFYESATAYEGLSGNSMSCVAGIVERLLTGLRGIYPVADKILSPSENKQFFEYKLEKLGQFIESLPSQLSVMKKKRAIALKVLYDLIDHQLMSAPTFNADILKGNDILDYIGKNLLPKPLQKRIGIYLTHAFSELDKTAAQQT